MGTNPSLIYIGHGSRGPNVTSWQVFLKSIGYHCPLSGEYDFQTEQATIRFQRERRVKDESGYVGPRTLAAAGLTFRGIRSHMFLGPPRGPAYSSQIQKSKSRVRPGRMG
jgi:peptidoglycan hydrolase-like protein with peptidoglycan-binding domain